jgi:glutamyl/glutaminyl-tRNA synthetase
VSDSRLRFHFHPTAPLTLGDARIALFGALWIRSLGGKLVASNENRSALDDLEWLGIEPDAMVSRPKPERYEEFYGRLLEAENAYPCFCGTAEAREMDVNADAWPEERRYDGRCRGLSANDKKALKKSRSPGIRLRPQEEIPAEMLGDAASTHRLPDFDFLIHDSQNGARRFFSRVVDESNARCSHTLRPEALRDDLPLEAQIRVLLELDAPEQVSIEPWDCEAAQAPVQQLRNEGYLPHALLRAMARTSWRGGDSASDLDSMVALFKIDDLKPSEDHPRSKADVEAINAASLDELSEASLTQEVVAHLTLRGYPIAEKDREWQERFVRATKPDLKTFGDAEELANHLLQDPSEFDRSTLRRLPSGDLTKLLDHFDGLMSELDEDSSRGWRRLIHKFRQEVPAPGRALSHIRVVMTGQPRGPSLGSVLWLLGVEECRARLEKARSLSQ